MGPHPQSKDRPMNVWGASFAGLPGIVIGRNDHIAWGVTNTGVDVQDLYVMEEDKTGSKYQWLGKWIPYNITNERIKVKGQDDIIIRVRSSLAGPVVTDNGV